MANRWVVFSVVLFLILGFISSAKAEDNGAGHDIKQHEKKIEEIEEKKREEEKEGEEFQGVEAKVRRKDQAVRLYRNQL